MAKNQIFIPYQCLKDSKFTRKEQQSIIATLLRFINHPIARKRLVYLDIKGLGKIYTHANKKRLDKKKYLKKYANKRNKQIALEYQMSEENLLY